MNFKIYTLGCKVNTYESEALSYFLKEKGWNLVDDDELADAIIVNSCTVTETADSKTKKLLRQIARTNPNTIIVVMGCYSQLNKEEASNYANIVLGTNNKLEVYNTILEYIKTKEEIINVTNVLNNPPYENMYLHSLSAHTRGFIKIQDGCNNFCAYCAIPYSRGSIRSRDADSVIDEINSLVNQGVKEIILSGINTGTYGFETKDMNLSKLIERIMKETKVYRIRLSSIELTEITDELLEIIKKYESRIAMHFHIPLQAGSDNTLKRMRRKYSTLEYFEKISKIRTIFDNPAITTDCLAGFVGETEEDFQDALEFIQKVNFSSMHVFPYSRRKGTLADSFEGHLPGSIIHDRARKMIEIAKTMKHKYMSEFIGKTVEVLFEQQKNGYYLGHTSNYLDVKVKSDIDLTNQVCLVELVKIDNDIMKGEIK